MRNKIDWFIYSLAHDYGIWFLSSYDGKLRVNWHYLKVGIVQYKGSIFFSRIKNTLYKLAF